MAADIFVQRANAAVEKHGRFLTALSGGGTPQPLYKLLSQSPYREKMPWEQTHVFWGDERLVPPDDEGSSYGMTAELLLNQVPIPAENIYRVLGEANPLTAVSNYTTKLTFFDKRGPWPRFDLILLGMGHDGHTASLFPGPISSAEKQEPIIAVTADYDGRPAQRITFTPKLINKASCVLFMVTGAKKAQALSAVVDRDPDLEKWPAQRINPRDGRLFWLVDAEAASLMKNFK